LKRNYRIFATQLSLSVGHGACKLSTIKEGGNIHYQDDNVSRCNANSIA